jgi:hypothetical protein
MEAQMEMNREGRQDTGERLRETAHRDRRESEKLARQLSSEAMKHWQRSVEGMLALPTAAALGVASSTLYMASLVGRAFEVLQQSTSAIREGMELTRRELRELAESEGDMRSGIAGRARSESNRGEVRA